MSQRPPSLDPVAAVAWHRRAPARSPWLHDEVARRMQERLEWIRLQPATWAHWEPVRAGMAVQALLVDRYPASQSLLVEPDAGRARVAARLVQPPWWRRWRAPRQRVVDAVPEGAAQMLWANMALHLAADPQALIGQWHRALATDGFLMFSCLGPDTLRELRALYAALGWPAPGPDFTDMHDWGDMLVNAGFAEPVMDMERITLTWATPQQVLAELRELGPNLHPARFPGLRGAAWRGQLEEQMSRALAGPDGRLALTFEVIYGHAVKPTPRLAVAPESAVSLGDMKALLRADSRRMSDLGRP